MNPSLFDDLEAPNGRKILMDLNVALSSNFAEMRQHHMATFVKSVETYRDWMVDLLRDEYVILITARDQRWANDTLRRIHQETGWTPQEAWFNDTGISGQYAPKVKKALLHSYVFPQHGMQVSQYLAIESNSETRKMYQSLGIRAIDCERQGKWHAIPA